jgi:hypothetical protein
MTRFVNTKVIRATVAIIAIAVGIALTPGRVLATCGDYVLIEGQSPVRQHLNHLPVTAPGESQGNPDSPRAPCHGPGCSKAPNDSIPPLTAPTGGETDSKNPPAPLSGAAPGDGGMSWECHFIASGRPIHLPNPIFHPPRAA